MHGTSALCHDDGFAPRRTRGFDRLCLKLAWLDPSGSINLEAVVTMVESTERKGCVGSTARPVESSYGMQMLTVGPAGAITSLDVLQPATV